MHLNVFYARKDSDSEHYIEACTAVQDGQFKGVALSTKNSKLPAIPKGQFYQAVADSMSARMLPESEKALSRATEVLNPLALPADMSPEYGECDVKF